VNLPELAQIVEGLPDDVGITLRVRDLRQLTTAALARHHGIEVARDAGRKSVQTRREATASRNARIRRAYQRRRRQVYGESPKATCAKLGEHFKLSGKQIGRIVRGNGTQASTCPDTDSYF
jgi:hypothetical protein